MRDRVYRDRQLENLEELLLDLRGGGALPLRAYAEDDDSVTRVLELPVRVADASPRVRACVSAPGAVEQSSAAGMVDCAPRSSATAERPPLVPPDLDLERLSLEGGSLRVKRAVMAVSALAMTAIFVTLFSISATSEDRVREAARQREAAAAVKINAPERATAPDPSNDGPVEERPSRQRRRGVPRGAAAMVMDVDEGQSADKGGRAGASEAARQRL